MKYITPGNNFGWRLRTLENRTTEAELYCAETCYGNGANVLEFKDGSTFFESDCFELSLENIKSKIRGES